MVYSFLHQKLSPEQNVLSMPSLANVSEMVNTD